MKILFQYLPCHNCILGGACPLKSERCLLEYVLFLCFQVRIVRTVMLLILRNILI